uniref:Uncharacterized protein n=1 Tax=Rhizophagus irregularis (strain DAOM 181602 / DAOM 197198 / MUCL 43194) TaxID=747089 RepID=U9TZ88_RHIID
MLALVLVESGYISVCELKALKALNMDRELPLDHTQEEIEENLNKLKSKLEHPTTKADINLYGSLKQSLAGIESLDLIWRDPKASMVLSDNSDINNRRADGKKPDIMGLLEQDEKIIELLYTESSRIVCSNSKKSDDEVKLWRETLDEASYISALCRPTGNQFGIVGIQVAEIPLSPYQSRPKSLIRLLLTLRNAIFHLSSEWLPLRYNSE